MKLLKTKKAFYDEIIKMSKEKPSFFYMASYNLYNDDNLRAVFKNVAKVPDVKIIVGVSEKSSIKALEYTLDDFNYKLFRDCHLKLIVTNKGAIVGGRNLTGSDWIDLSIKLVGKPAILEIKNEFLKHFSKRGI